MKSRHFIFLSIFAIDSTSFGQTAPCGLTYGSPADVENITLNMYDGSIAETIDAINTAKNTRGTAVGCPEIEIEYLVGDYAEPTLAEIETVWNTAIQPEIEAFEAGCPRIGRYENNLALSAYYARLAGYYDNLNSLASIGT